MVNFSPFCSFNKLRKEFSIADEHMLCSILFGRSACFYVQSTITLAWCFQNPPVDREALQGLFPSKVSSSVEMVFWRKKTQQHQGSQSCSGMNEKLAVFFWMGASRNTVRTCWSLCHLPRQSQWTTKRDRCQALRNVKQHTNGISMATQTHIPCIICLGI